MGLAMYNGINLDIKLPFVAYKKLLSPAVVPNNNPKAPCGVIPNPSLYDLDSIMPVSITKQFESDLLYTTHSSLVY